MGKSNEHLTRVRVSMRAWSVSPSILVIKKKRYFDQRSREKSETHIYVQYILR